MTSTGIIFLSTTFNVTRCFCDASESVKTRRGFFLKHLLSITRRIARTSVEDYDPILCTCASRVGFVMINENGFVERGCTVYGLGYLMTNLIRRDMC